MMKSILIQKLFYQMPSTASENTAVQTPSNHSKWCLFQRETSLTMFGGKSKWITILQRVEVVKASLDLTGKYPNLIL